MQLTWQKHHDPIFGSGYRLTGLPTEDDSGSSYYSAGRYVAHAFIGGRYLNHKAGTLRAAMTRLEREIDKRSIGLLNVDDIEFVVA